MRVPLRVALFTVLAVAGCSPVANAPADPDGAARCPDQAAIHQRLEQAEAQAVALGQKLVTLEGELARKEAQAAQARAELDEVRSLLAELDLSLAKLRLRVRLPENVKSAADERLATYWALDEALIGRARRLRKQIESGAHPEDQVAILQAEADYVKELWWENKRRLDPLMKELGYHE